MEDDRALQAEITDRIQEDFYKPVDAEKLRERSLKGTVEALDDPFSQYLPPDEAQQFAQAVEGEFEGVGMTVDEDRRGLRVLNSFPNSPARKAGHHQGRPDHRGERPLAGRGRQPRGHRADQGPGRQQRAPSRSATGAASRAR